MKIEDTMMLNYPPQMAANNMSQKVGDTQAIEPSTAGNSDPCPLMMIQPVAGNEDTLVKPFGCNEFGDELFPISEDKPLFDIVLVKSNVKPLYRMGFPEEICPLLPSHKVPALLTCNSKTWKTTLIGDIERKKFESLTWRKFATDNNLKSDDCLIFQIMEDSSTKIKFALQILRGEFPSELEDLAAANTINID